MDLPLRSVRTGLSCLFGNLLVNISYALAKSSLDALFAHIEYFLVFSDNDAFPDRKILLGMIV